ncbi:MAG: hypothetical protein ACRDOH_21590 [Streptosporangiaceae bacterium]
MTVVASRRCPGRVVGDLYPAPVVEGTPLMPRRVMPETISRARNPADAVRIIAVRGSYVTKRD